LQDVDLRGGEVGQAAGVVDVEVGQDDVPDVVGRVAEPLDLANRGLVLGQHRL
jgi:hypothetical protein